MSLQQTNHLDNEIIYLLKIILEISFVIVMAAMIMVADRLKSYTKSLLFKRRHELSKTILASRDINDILVSVLVVFEASRAYLLMFHNGQEFSNTNPLWKITCTQEAVNKGISREQHKLSDKIVSQMWDLLEPYYNSESKLPGFEKFKIDNNIFFIVRVSKMDESYYKSILSSNGVKELIVSPIVNFENKIQGMLCVDYCDMSKIDIIEEKRNRIPSYSKDIWYTIYNTIIKQ